MNNFLAEREREAMSYSRALPIQDHKFPMNMQKISKETLKIERKAKDWAEGHG